VFGNFGAAVAALVAGALTDWISWRAAFIVPGLLAMATGAAFMLLVRAEPAVEETAQQETAAGEMPRGTVVRALIVLSLTTLCAGLIYQITSVAMPKIVALRISDIDAAGVLGVGGLVTAVYLSASFAQIGGGYLADRFPLKPVFVLAYLAQAPLYFVAAVLSGYPLLIAAVAMVSLSTGAAPAETVLYARFAPAKWRATVFGAKFAVALGVSALGVPVVAMIHENTGGFFWLFVMLGCLAALLVSAAMFLPPVGGERPAAGRAGPEPAASPSQGA